MKVKSPSLLFNSAVRMMALIEGDDPAKSRQALKVRTHKGKAALIALLTILAWTKVSSAQVTGDIGLPVIFVHGICDTPDSFLNAETAIQNKLQTAYPNQYPLTPALHTRYVAYYNGSSVQFQVPLLDIHNGEGNLPVTTVEPTTKFFMVALDDPNGWLYQLFDPSAVAAIPIYMKGNELANIIWRIKEITQAPRVIIVAHSMGGLDTRSYIEGLASPTGDTQAAIPYQNDVANIVTLDTPHEGSDLSALSLTFGGCAENPSTDKSEMYPLSPVMSQLEGALLPPSGLSITSIASFWYNSNDIIPMPDQGTDDVLSEQTQELNTIQNVNSPGLTSVGNIENKFQSTFNAIDSTGTTTSSVCSNLSSLGGFLPNIAQLHLLTCTGSQSQTFTRLETAITPSLFMNQSAIKINPSTANVSPSSTTTFTELNDTGVIWSILEGADGGSITQRGVYTSPANITGTSETVHIIAIDSNDLYHYGETTIQVGKNAIKVATTTLLTTSATQVLVGASLTINATVQASGGTPTGTVTFYDGGKALSAALLNNSGVATYNSSSFSLGSHSITAQYGGDNNFTSSTSSAVTIAIVAIKPQLSVSPTSGTLGVTSFVKTDTGFAPNGLITHTATLPGGSLSVLQTYADGTGSYQYNRTYSVVGTYSQIDTDGTTGQATIPVTWTVSAPVVNDFSLQLSPSSQSVNQGGSVTYTVIITTTSGSSQSIALSATNLPSGVTASFNPSTVASGSQSILTLSATSSAASGTYSLTLVGTGSSASHTIPFSATVVQVTHSGALLTSSPLNFTFNSQTVNTASAPFVFSLVNSGGSALTISSVTESPQFIASFLNGQGLPITLQPNGGSANMQVVFIPNATGQQTGTIKLFNSTNASPLTLNVSGTGVAAPVTTGNIQINATFNGAPWTGGVYYNLTGPEPYTGGTAPNTYYNLVPGAYTVAYAQAGGPFSATFTGVTPSATQSLAAGATLTYTLNFTGANTFAVGDTTPTSAVLGSGTSTQFAITLCILKGATQAVNMAVSGLPPSATASFSPNPASVGCSSAGSTATITTSKSTPPGIYSLVFTGTNQDGYSTSNSTPTSLTVDVPPVSPTNRVSLSNTGAQGNGLTGATSVNSNMYFNPVSANGRYVAFVSAATNLVPNDTNSQQDIFVRDLQLGTTTRASVASNGTQGDNQSLMPSISGDGRYVSFSSVADNLVAGSVQGQQGVYLHDMTTGITTRLDLAPNGTAGNGTACCSSVSGDGRFIAFASAATNLMQGVSGENVYRYDTKTQQLSMASVASDGITVGGGTSPQISADGRFVAFTSFATNLVIGDTNGKNNAFVHDFATGQTTRVNVASDGTEDNCGVSYVTAIPVAISADGRYVTFISCGNTLATSLVNPYEFDTAYVHDMNTGQTSALLADPQNNVIFIADMGTLSADGRFVSFGRTYLDDRTTGQLTLLNVAANGSGGNGTSFVATTSMDGSSAVFSSNSTNLVANDTNTNTDVFSFANPFLSSPRASSLTLGVTQAPGGSQVAGTITLNAPAPTGGATVAVWSNNSAAQPPAEVLVPVGATSASFTIPTALVPSETVMTIIASYDGGSEVSLLTLEPAPQLSVSPSAWDFGYQAVSTSSAAESFALTNSGTAALTINSVQLTSGQVFSISANTCGSSIVAGGSCSISVAFKPSASGSASDAVQISYGSPATIQSISLTGDGATPLAGLSPATLSFGNQAMPGSATAVATLSNSGNASLTNISASVSGTNAADFAISSDGCSGVILPANSNCQVSIAFTPKAKGSRQATLSIADSASGSPQAISLTGTGVQSTPTVLWNPSAGSLTYGTPLGTGVLDATANQNGSNLAGTFAYTATISGGTPQAVTQATVLGVGAYTLTATFTPTDTTDYTTATATTSITVNGIAPTITFTVPNHTYGDVAFTVAATSNSSGTITYSVVSGPATISGSTVTLTGAGTVVLQASEAAAGNYTTGTQTATFTVAGQAPTITFTVTNHTYGDAPFTVSATSNSSGTITYSVVSGTATISGSTVTLTGAGTIVLQASQVASGNYAAKTQTATFTVAGQAPTISFTVPNHTYGDAPITVSATSSSTGAVTYSVVSGPATISGSTVTLTGAGTVVLQVSQAAAGNYVAGTQTATFTVAGNAPTISFTVPNHTYGDAPFTVAATSNSSGAITYSVVSGPATISGSTVTLTGAGSVVLQASQVAAGNYTAGTQTATVTVAKESQAITFTAPASPVNYGVAPISLSASASSGLAITFSVLSGPATVSGSTLTITGAGTVVVAANQAGNTNYAAAAQVSQSIVVNAASQTISFTAPTSPVTYGVSPITLVATGGASSNAVVYSVVSGPATVSGSTLTITGAGTVVVAANQAGNANYAAATQVTQSVTVNQASQTISFTQPTSPVTYGIPPITLSATSTSGLAVTFSVVSGPGTVSGSTLTITGVGTVVVAANQAGNANYSAATQATQSIVVNVIGAAATPTFSPVAGTYTAAQTVSISDTISGATIYYTTDGTTPTTSSTKYTTAITVSATETIQAIATATGYSTSAVATAAYTISIPTNPVPAINGISPAFTNAGGTVFTLTVNGSGLIASSTVYWGTSALTTTYVSATQITAQVPAADIATAGTVAITVQTPAPGGGTTNAWQFEVDSASSGTTAPTITSTTETVAAGSVASYPVTVPSSVTSVYVSCLNLPTGASCSYSSTTNTVTISTSSTTPKGVYQIIVVFTETVSGAASGFILLPILLLPLGFMRRKLAARGIWLTACLGLVLMATAALSIGCGGGSSGGSSSTTPPATHQVTSSGAVSLTIQ